MQLILSKSDQDVDLSLKDQSIDNSQFALQLAQALKARIDYAASFINLKQHWANDFTEKEYSYLNITYLVSLDLLNVGVFHLNSPVPLGTREYDNSRVWAEKEILSIIVLSGFKSIASSPEEESLKFACKPA